MVHVIKRCTNSLIELWIWLIGCLLVASALFSYFEHVSYWQAFYWACVTATSTGYGDISPKTVPGQILSIILMFAALFFILPLMIVRVINAVVDNPDQFSDAEQRQLLEDTAFIRKWIETREPEPKYKVGDFVMIYEGMGEHSFGEIDQIVDGKYRIALSWGGGVIESYRYVTEPASHATRLEARDYYIARSGGKQPPTAPAKAP